VLAGGAEGDLQKLLKQNFTKVAHVKPPASRADSSEKFVVATGFRGQAEAEAEGDGCENGRDGGDDQAGSLG